jgi:hypothetical protein
MAHTAQVESPMPTVPIHYLQRHCFLTWRPGQHQQVGKIPRSAPWRYRFVATRRGHRCPRTRAEVIASAGAPPAQIGASVSTVPARSLPTCMRLPRPTQVAASRQPQLQAIASTKTTPRSTTGVATGYVARSANTGQHHCAATFALLATAASATCSPVRSPATAQSTFEQVRAPACHCRR